MVCTKCGKEIKNDSKFCDGCGQAVVVETKSIFDDIQEVEEVKKPIESEEIDEPILEEEVEVNEEVEAIDEDETVKEPIEPVKPVEAVKTPEKPVDVSLVKPIGIFGFIWIFILMSIPIVNVIMVLVWAFSKNKNVNKKNYAWAAIILFLVFLAGSIFAFIQIGLSFSLIFDDIKTIIDSL